MLWLVANGFVRSGCVDIFTPGETGTLVDGLETGGIETGEEEAMPSRTISAFAGGRTGELSSLAVSTGHDAEEDVTADLRRKVGFSSP
jgi:hypothetical protein